MPGGTQARGKHEDAQSISLTPLLRGCNRFAGRSRRVHNAAMDKWNCPFCQEELLGAANRCWKCGNQVRQPRPIEEPLVAVVVNAPQLASLTADEVAVATPKEPPRRGSPFAFEAPLTESKFATAYDKSSPYRNATTVRRPDAPLAAYYPQDTGAAVGSVTAALLLAFASLFILYFTLLGAITAMLGLGFAMRGLFSPRRALAVVALVICCLALTLAAWRLGFAVYEFYFPPGTGAGATAPLGS
jgi:hypothetical protein